MQCRLDLLARLYWLCSPHWFAVSISLRGQQPWHPHLLHRRQTGGTSVLERRRAFHHLDSTIPAFVQLESLPNSPECHCANQRTQGEAGPIGQTNAMFHAQTPRTSKQDLNPQAVLSNGGQLAPSSVQSTDVIESIGQMQPTMQQAKLMQQAQGTQQDWRRGPVTLAAMQRPQETIVVPDVLGRQPLQQQTQQPQQWMVQTPWGPMLMQGPPQQTAQNEAMQSVQQMQPQSMPQLLPQSPPQDPLESQIRQASLAIPPGTLPFPAARQFGGQETVIQGRPETLASENMKQGFIPGWPQSEAMPGNIQVVQQTLPQMALPPTLPQALPQAFIQNQEPSFSPWTGTDERPQIPLLQPGLAQLQRSLPGQYMNTLSYQVR